MLANSIQFILMLLVLAMIVAVLYALRYVFILLELKSVHQKKILRLTGLGFFLWLGAVGVMAYYGFFRNFEVIPPRILLATIPPIAFAIYLAYSKSFKPILGMIPPAWLIYIQSFRIIVELILWMGLKAGFVPFQMTFEGFNYDIVVGVTALLAGFTFFGKGRRRRFQAFIWNLFGLALLFNIVWISVMSMPTPFQLFTNEPANKMIAFFPFIWIPTFIIPFAFTMHLLSIRQLQMIGKDKGRTFQVKLKT